MPGRRDTDDEEAGGVVVNVTAHAAEIGIHDPPGRGPPQNSMRGASGPPTQDMEIELRSPVSPQVYPYDAQRDIERRPEARSADGRPLQLKLGVISTKSPGNHIREPSDVVPRKPPAGIHKCYTTCK